MPFGRIGPVEIIIVLVIVLLIFGPGRIGKIAGELGQSIRNFRDGISGKDDENQEAPKTDEKK